MRLKSIAAALIGACTLVGCASTTYYEVKDPGTGRKYYSTDVEKSDAGSVTLKDDRTKAHVTIQSSEVMVITKEQYEAGLIAPQEGSPTPPAPK